MLGRGLPAGRFVLSAVEVGVGRAGGLSEDVDDRISFSADDLPEKELSFGLFFFLLPFALGLSQTVRVRC